MTNEALIEACRAYVKWLDDPENVDEWACPDIIPSVRTLARHVAALADSAAAPIRLRLTCEACGALHVDEGVFATKPHHTHLCEECGLTWRPAEECTVGVRFLWPVVKNANAKETP